MRTPTIAATVLVLASLVACGSSSGSSASAGTTAAGTTGASTCAKADGSSPKTTKFAAAPPVCLESGAKYTAVIETNFGTLHVKLLSDISPVTVNNFVNLARFHYFDSTTCHRAIKTFVVQCGDPTATGMGGPGYTFPDELSKVTGYSIGSVAMANSGPDTNGSQFFIITGDAGAQLPVKYNLFGQVDQNDFSVVQALDDVANPQDGPPLKPIDITKVTITAG